MSEPAPSAPGLLPHFVVVGIGADGWDGLSPRAQRELRDATVIYGSARQLALLPGDLAAETIAWASPMSEHLRAVLAPDTDQPDTDQPGTDQPGTDQPGPGRRHLLASGDPMFHGLGASVVRAVGRERVTVLPGPSSVSLAAARLGWDLARCAVHSLVTAPPETLVPLLTDGARILVLSRDADSPAQVAALLCERGFGRSELTVLGELGGAEESSFTAPARSWPGEPAPALNILAVECSGPARSPAPGRDDDEYAHDGQLTKQTVRAITVAALAPAENQLLWDVGAGSGSVGIEWLRQSTTGRVIAFEADPARAARIVENARTHGVAERLTVAGAAPEALRSAPAPDTVFVGGGLDSGVLEHCWEVLGSRKQAGRSVRLVVNAVTLETEQLLVAAHAARGGTLIRLALDRAGALGGRTAWRPALPVVQWTVTR